MDSVVDKYFHPHPKPGLPNIGLSLSVPNLDLLATSIFFKNCNPSTALSSAVDTVFAILYKATQTTSHFPPPTRFVTLIVHYSQERSYTTGSALDHHKQIHLSMAEIITFERPERHREEIQGILVHQMVQCLQWTANGTAPTLLCRGIADFVRLKAGLSSPRWKKEPGELERKWGLKHHHIGYFLEWLEDKYGTGTVMTINDRLKDGKFVANKFWMNIFGKGIGQLWKDYSKTLLPTNGVC
ncbi:hypothetical protein MMC07_002165 [Pseudocyphellaria aurata]|nr:hypothetical protein [Pseudocyphellaria aurata]